jgi:hypothetical protein
MHMHADGRCACPAQATANPVVRGVVVSGANVLPQREIEEAFGDQFGKTLNFPAFSASLRRLNRWYEDRGIFGQARARPLCRCMHECACTHLRRHAVVLCMLNACLTSYSPCAPLCRCMSCACMPL